MYKKIILAALLAAPMTTITGNVSLCHMRSSVELTMSTQKEKSRKSKIKEIKKALVKSAKESSSSAFDSLLDQMTGSMASNGADAAQAVALIKKSFKLYEKKYFAKDLEEQYDKTLEKMSDAEIDKLYLVFSDSETIQCYDKYMTASNDISMTIMEDMMNIITGKNLAKTEKVECAAVYRQLADIQIKNITEDSSLQDKFTQLESLGEEGEKMANKFKDYLNNDLKEVFVKSLLEKLTEAEAEKVLNILSDAEFSSSLNNLSQAFNSEGFRESMAAHLKECMMEVVMQGATM